MACRNTVCELTYHKLANLMLSLSDLQGFLQKVESDTKEAENHAKEGAAMSAESETKVKRKRENEAMKYYRCGRIGHHQNECYSSKWICYVCNKLVNDYKSSTYPQKAQAPGGDRGTCPLIFL